jgi:predicted nucleic acid-binding protein
MGGFVVLPYSGEVAEIWARMHAKLSGHLHRGGTNDLWTAACAAAMKPRLPIATNNLKDFLAIATAFPEIRLVHPDI